MKVISFKPSIQATSEFPLEYSCSNSCRAKERGVGSRSGEPTLSSAGLMWCRWAAEARAWGPGFGAHSGVRIPAPPRAQVCDLGRATGPPCTTVSPLLRGRWQLCPAQSPGRNIESIRTQHLELSARTKPRRSPSCANSFGSIIA